MLRIVIGLVMVGLAYQSDPNYAPVLFVQGMIFINFGVNDWGKKSSINHL